MTIESPIFGLVALMPAIVIVVLARRLPAMPRWLLRTAAVCAVGAAAGLTPHRSRPLNIAVMIDVSPSTRGATFRDPLSVRTRLTPLLGGRAYKLHYFADGLQPTADEPACSRTRLAVPDDADAVVLMSDGRLTAPAVLPPIFAVIDPALNAPADARVVDVRDAGAGAVVIDVVGDGEHALTLTGSSTTPPAPARGPAMIAVRGSGVPIFAHFNSGDRWPENDAMTLFPADRPVARWAAAVSVAGFELTEALPTDAGDYVDVASVVVSTRTELSPARQAALKTFVTEFGGTLVLAGPPGAAASGLRALSPLDAVPPAGTQRWVILLDSSGSMAAASDAGRTRWDDSRAAASAALDRLPAGARVDVLRFARDVKTVAANATPAEAKARLVADTETPSGPTGLRAALLATPAGSRAVPTRVLLLTDGDADLGNIPVLGLTLRASEITVDAVAATPATALAELCRITGGRLVAEVAPAAWSAALGGFVNDASPASTLPATAVGREQLAGETFAIRYAWPAYSKTGSDALATADGRPVVAAWQVGAGRVVAIAADASPADLAKVATRLERPAVDPRYQVNWDAIAGVVRLTAADRGVPINELSPRLTRAGRVMAFDQIGPGVYAASLERLNTATVAAVIVGNAVVGRQALPSRYAEEFDAVGNDRDALAALATRSGGAVIEAGDRREIGWPVRFAEWRLRGTLAVAAAVLLIASVLAIRAGSSPGVPGEGTLRRFYEGGSSHAMQRDF